MTRPPERQVPGIYHRRVGDILVTALSDGAVERSVEMLRNIAADEGERLLADAFRPAINISVNAFLIYVQGRLALVDTGSGDYLGSSAGHLPAALAAAGVAPEAIEAILLTHMHPDHSAGLTDLASGTRRFPNAELVVHENEPRHWLDDAAMGRASAREKQ
jgi:glyoxylase-like metal-dependent hydrolase (beta-lactamase superfamily II)